MVFPELSENPQDCVSHIHRPSQPFTPFQTIHSLNDNDTAFYDSDGNDAPLA